MKSRTFNCKTSYRIVKTDSNVCAAVHVPDTQIENSRDGKTVADTFT